MFGQNRQGDSFVFGYVVRVTLRSMQNVRDNTRGNAEDPDESGAHLLHCSDGSRRHRTKENHMSNKAILQGKDAVTVG